ncbi:hypothetical protein NG819_00050 [Pseudarthrobacter sp. Fe7]|nr:hypothetical protein NG819_00050 [Pseudarthrobacter sp. Fe7]
MVGTDNEVELRSPRPGSDLGRGPLAVGVDGMQVRVATVPAGALAFDLQRRVLRTECGTVRPVLQGHVDGVIHALFRHLVGSQRDAPRALTDGTWEVPRGGLGGADEELGPEAARPAAETLPRQVGALFIEDADVAGVGEQPRGGCGLAVAVGDADLVDTGRNLDRKVHEVSRARVEMAGDGLGLAGARIRGGEGHRCQRHGSTGQGGGQEPAAGSGQGNTFALMGFTW